MNTRRLLFYNDGRHEYMYCYDPPMRIEDAWAPVDEIAGTAVDTLVLGFGVGSSVFHNTQVGEIWGKRLDVLPLVHDWRAYENIMSLIDRGLDPLTLLIDRAHEKGLEFFGSLRLSQGGDPREVDIPDISQFAIDHPELCLKGRGKYNFNFVHPEVRAERFALIEETVNRYDVDGFELDWVFNPIYFEDDEVEQNTPILIEYMREIRRTVEKAARNRGRPIALGARVLPVLSGNLAAGLDVPTWIREGLLDFVAPNFYIDHQMDSDNPFEWLVDLARPTECQVYPPLQYRVESAGEYAASVEHYRAGAASYWSRGADGIYVPWFNWPIGAEQRQILSEIHDPDLLTEKTKHYVVRRLHEEAASYGYTAQLPLELTVGMDVPGQRLKFFLADDLERGYTCLKLRLVGSTSLDSMTVSLNGKTVSPELCRRTEHRYFYTWLEYSLPRGLLHRGYNELGLALHTRPHNLKAQVSLESVELVVTYPEVKRGEL